MPRRSRFDYFAAFERISAYAEEEADMLRGLLTDFDPALLPEQLRRMHEMENAADQVNHDVFTSIVTEFITPIDREDIIELTQELDTVVDRIEAVLQHIYMLNIQVIDVPEALEMVCIIEKSTKSLRQALIEFPNYKRSKTLHDHLVNVNTFEEEADAVYLETLHRLYVEDGDPVRLAAWAELFDRLERSCDSCEHAADVITTIIMKNS